MPNKCESCRFQKTDSFESDMCASPDVNAAFSGHKKAMLSLGTARDICDRESNGIFVYFEPKEPSTGATFVQIERVRSPHVSKGSTSDQTPPQTLKAAA